MRNQDVQATWGLGGEVYVDKKGGRGEVQNGKQVGSNEGKSLCELELMR